MVTSSTVAHMTLGFLAANRHQNLQDNVLLHTQILHPADLTDVCRETTVLEAKLEKLAALIGQIGLGAGLLAFGALASQFSWQKFVVEGQSWDWAFAPEYLRFLITSITILVYCPCHSLACPAL